MLHSLVLIVVSAISFLIIALLAEILQRAFHFRHELTRKFAHIGVGILSCFLFSWLGRGEIIILSVLAAVAVAISKYFHFFDSIHGVERYTHGEVYFPLSIGLLAAFFLPTQPEAALFGILVLSVSDALAGIVGTEFGSRKILFLGHSKTLEGSLAFFISTFLIFLFLIPYFSVALMFFGFLVAIILTIVELFGASIISSCLSSPASFLAYPYLHFCGSISGNLAI